MKELKNKDIERELFINEVMGTGPCPKCGGLNVHDCSAPEFVTVPTVPFPFDPTYKETIKIGSECEVARKLDNIFIGHCDDCNYIWCLDCGSELSIENPVCKHILFCENCSCLDKNDAILEATEELNNIMSMLEKKYEEHPELLSKYLIEHAEEISAKTPNMIDMSTANSDECPFPCIDECPRIIKFLKEMEE